MRVLFGDWSTLWKIREIGYTRKLWICRVDENGAIHATSTAAAAAVPFSGSGADATNITAANDGLLFSRFGDDTGRIPYLYLTMNAATFLVSSFGW